MARPREHGPATRAALVAAAGELLAAEGVGAVTVRRVAERAGTSTRAVYSVFDDKRGLVRELFREAAETMRRHHEAVPEGPDLLVEITALALAYRSAALEIRNLYGLYPAGAGAVELEPEDVALAMRSLDRVLATLGRAAEAGHLPGRTPAQVAQQLWALVHGLASLELQDCLLAEPLAVWTGAVEAAVQGYARAPVGQSRESASSPAGRSRA